MTLLCVKQYMLLTMTTCLLVRLSSFRYIFHLCCWVKLWLLNIEETEPFINVLLGFFLFWLFLSRVAYLGLYLFIISSNSCWLEFRFQTSPMVIDVTWTEIIVFGSPVYDLILIYTGLHFIFKNAVSLNCYSQFATFP